MLEVEFTPSTRVLKGLDEIGRYLRVHRRTVWRWVRDYALPAMKGPSGAYITTTSLIDLWVLACWRQQRPAKNGEAPILPDA